MRFERDETYIFSPLVDQEGRRYSEMDSGYINFGSVSYNLLHSQAQYGSRYIDGAIKGYPSLGKGLRFQGDHVNYHSLGIHPDDIEEFLLRFHAYEAWRDGIVVDDYDTPYEITDHEREILRGYLESIGAFDAQ